MTYTYIVWVGGVDDYYVNYSDAKRDYDYWISQGYDDVILEKILSALITVDKTFVVKDGKIIESGRWKENQNYKKNLPRSKKRLQSYAGASLTPSKEAAQMNALATHSIRSWIPSKIWKGKF